MSKFTVDLHDSYNNSKAIEASLNDAFFYVYEAKIKTLEIIHGKGSGQLKKRVLPSSERIGDSSSSGVLISAPKLIASPQSFFGLKLGNT